MPATVLHLLPGDGAVGAALVKRPARRRRRLHRLQRDRLARSSGRSPSARGAIVPFIAETGGINAMIADFSALPEQVIRDAVRSAFD